MWADWNTVVATVAKTKLLGMLNLAPVLPDGVELTCSSGLGRILDWAVVSTSLRGVIHSMEPVAPVFTKPHIVARLKLLSNPRGVLKWQIRAPFLYELRQGPTLPWEHHAKIAAQLRTDGRLRPCGG